MQIPAPARAPACTLRLGRLCSEPDEPQGFRDRGTAIQDYASMVPRPADRAQPGGLRRLSVLGIGDGSIRQVQFREPEAAKRGAQADQQHGREANPGDASQSIQSRPQDTGDA